MLEEASTLADSFLTRELWLTPLADGLFFIDDGEAFRVFFSEVNVVYLTIPVGEALEMCGSDRSITSFSGFPGFLVTVMLAALSREEPPW